ncbi:MAG: MCE family protein [Gordonia amarae]
MNFGSEFSGGAKKAAAAALVFFVVAVVVLAIMQFQAAFTRTIPVTVVADRAGLVMNPEAKVQLRGVRVGRVAAIDEDPGRGKVTLKLDIERDQVKYIPANVGAMIRSNTVFGAKSVELQTPDDPSPQKISSGAVITGDRVAVELNTVYQRLVGVLAELEPVKLNVVLGTLSKALEGNGNKLGEGLSGLSKLLGTMTSRGRAETLRNDISSAGRVIDTYADAAPDLVRTVDNLTNLGNTLRDKQSDLDSLLVNLTGMADAGNQTLAPKKDTLITTLSDFTQTATLFGGLAPGVRCFFEPIARVALGTGMQPGGVFGTDTGFFKFNATLRPNKDSYRYPDDLPKVGAEGGPTCMAGLSNVNQRTPAPFYVADTSDRPYQPRTSPQVNPKRLFQLMFGEYPGPGPK